MLSVEAAESGLHENIFEALFLSCCTVVY